MHINDQVKKLTSTLNKVGIKTQVRKPTLENDPPVMMELDGSRKKLIINVNQSQDVDQDTTFIHSCLIGMRLSGIRKCLVMAISGTDHV